MRVHVYPPVFRVRRCGHVFHEACLLSWLEESLSASWDAVWGELEVRGGVKEVPGSMRGGMLCEECDGCCELRNRIARSEAGSVEVGDLVERIKGKSVGRKEEQIVVSGAMGDG